MTIYRARTKDFPPEIQKQLEPPIVEFSYENGLVKMYHELFDEVEIDKETFVNNLKERLRSKE